MGFGRTVAILEKGGSRGQVPAHSLDQRRARAGERGGSIGGIRGSSDTSGTTLGERRVPHPGQKAHDASTRRSHFRHAAAIVWPQCGQKWYSAAAVWRHEGQKRAASSS